MNNSLRADAGLASRPLDNTESRSEPPRRRWAIAAGGAVLFLLGGYEGYSWSAPQPSPVAFESGRLVATGELENALYDPFTGSREHGPTAGQSFTNADGETCRRFADGPVTGIACQHHGDWRVIEMRQN